MFICLCVCTAAVPEMIYTLSTRSLTPRSCLIDRRRRDVTSAGINGTGSPALLLASPNSSTSSLNSDDVDRPVTVSVPPDPLSSSPLVRYVVKYRLYYNHRKAFYRSANAVFGKVGRVASEEVTLQLINRKCIPSLLYGLEAFPLVKSELSSLDFVVNRFFL